MDDSAGIRNTIEEKKVGTHILTYTVFTLVWTHDCYFTGLLQYFILNDSINCVLTGVSTLTVK